MQQEVAVTRQDESEDARREVQADGMAALSGKAGGGMRSLGSGFVFTRETGEFADG